MQNFELDYSLCNIQLLTHTIRKALYLAISPYTKYYTSETSRSVCNKAKHLPNFKRLSLEAKFYIDSG